jgi:antitoxin component YwqK of YwqJK toxin-antitoxin module
MKNIVLLISALLLLNSCDFLTEKSKEQVEGKEIQKKEATAPKVKNGTKKYYFDTGELKSIVQYKDNKKTGVSETFYKTGEKQYDIPYVDGMKHGVVKWYYKDGKVYRETNYIKGKKDGYQKKFWENGKIKSEFFYKNDLLGVGLKEITKSGKVKSVPSIKVEKIDLMNSKEEYVLKFRLSNRHKKVKFYQGKLIEGKFFPANGRGFKELETKAGVGELRIPVPKGFNINKDVHVVAMETTAYQNKRVLTIVVPVSVRNPN